MRRRDIIKSGLTLGAVAAATGARAASKGLDAERPAVSARSATQGPPWSWDAVALAAAIRGKQISAREATLSCLDRLGEVNPRLNAVVDVLADEALAAADLADRVQSSGGTLGRLHGVPVTVKINEDYKGRPTTGGVVAARNDIAPDDGSCVRNFRREGAIIIGRTNTPAFSYRWFTENDLHGRTLNPWNPALTPGGSSGGASSAVAAGVGALAHGNDIGGSVRYPAFACGVVGVKPTPGRIPSFAPGNTAGAPIGAQLMGVQGVLARRVRDARLGFEALAQGDERDATWVPAPMHFPATSQPLRVALFTQAEGVSADPTVAASVRSAGKALSAVGYVVEEVAPPSYSELVTLWSSILTNESRLGSVNAIMSDGDARIKVAMQAFLDNTPEVDLKGMEAALARRSEIMHEWAAFLSRYPVVVMPSSWQRPFLLDLDQQGAKVMGRILEAQGPLLAIAVLGLPSVAVPTGVVDDLPTGVQVVARSFREDMCFDTAEIIEAAHPMPTPLSKIA